MWQVSTTMTAIDRTIYCRMERSYTAEELVEAYTPRIRRTLLCEDNDPNHAKPIKPRISAHFPYVPFLTRISALGRNRATSRFRQVLLHTRLFCCGLCLASSVRNVIRLRIRRHILLEEVA